MRNARIHYASTVASIFAGFKSSWLQCGVHTAIKGVKNTHNWSRWTQLHKNWVGKLDHAIIAPVAWSSACVKTMTVGGHCEHCFWFRRCFSSDNITATFLAVVDQSNSCTPICRFGLIALVTYNFVLCNTWQLSNSQGKVATLIMWGGLLLC